MKRTILGLHQWFRMLAVASVLSVMPVMCSLTVYGQGGKHETAPKSVADEFRRATGIQIPTARERTSIATLETRVRCFTVRNAPMNYVVYCLRALGVQVCWEAILAEHHCYVDEDGVGAYGGDKLVSVDLGKDPSICEILTQICEADPRYVWSCHRGSSVVNIIPRDGSGLGFLIGPVAGKGNPCEVLRRIAQDQKADILRCQGDGVNLPEIDVTTGRASAREMLNEMVIHQPGLTWVFGYASGPTIVRPIWEVSFSYFPSAAYEGVRLDFPRLPQGTHVETGWYYATRRREHDHIAEITLEKRKR